MREEFEKIVNKNLIKWKRLNKWLASERLGKKLIKKRYHKIINA
jgi:hypothetical protein